MSGDDYCDFLFKIVLIGDCGAGKTCVVQRFKTGAFVERHGNTIGVDFSMKNVVVDGKKVKLQIWDTAGQERFRTITQSYYRSANGVIIVYDITKRSSFLSLERWIEEVRRYAATNVLLVLVVLKLEVRREKVMSQPFITQWAEIVTVERVQYKCIRLHMLLFSWLIKQDLDFTRGFGSQRGLAEVGLDAFIYAMGHIIDEVFKTKQLKKFRSKNNTAGKMANQEKNKLENQISDGCGNKSDLENLREVEFAEAEAMCEFVPEILCVLEASAKENTNIEDAFLCLATELKRRHDASSCLADNEKSTISLGEGKSVSDCSETTCSLV